MKRFLAFSGMQYYPGGGWEDFRGDFDTAEEAYKVLKERFVAEPTSIDWYQVIDTETMEALPYRSLDPYWDRKK